MADRGSIRHAQVASRMVRLLQERLARGLGDPRYQGMVSVLGIDVDERQGEARVRVSVFPAERERLTIDALTSAAPRLRADLLGPMRLRRMPQLTFQADDSLRRMADIGQAAATDPTPSPEDTDE